MSRDLRAAERTPRPILASQRHKPSQSSNGPQLSIREEVISSNGERKRKREVLEDDRESQLESDSPETKMTIEQRREEGGQKKQRARLKNFIEDRELEEEDSEQVGESKAEEPRLQNGQREPSEERKIVEDGQHELSTTDLDKQNDSMSAANQGMSAQENQWYKMRFEELYTYARSRGCRLRAGRKSGRFNIVKWLCEKEGITPYVAPTVTSVSATPIIARPTLRSSGAVSHPEAILCTSDPAVQLLIDKKAEEYRNVSWASLRQIAKERSYLLLKDSDGKCPPMSITATSRWLAAWDALKSPREKNW